MKNYNLLQKSEIDLAKYIRRRMMGRFKNWSHSADKELIRESYKIKWKHILAIIPDLITLKTKHKKKINYFFAGDRLVEFLKMCPSNNTLTMGTHFSEKKYLNIWNRLPASGIYGAILLYYHFQFKTPIILFIKWFIYFFSKNNPLIFLSSDVNPVELLITLAAKKAGAVTVQGGHTSGPFWPGLGREDYDGLHVDYKLSYGEKRPLIRHIPPFESRASLVLFGPCYEVNIPKKNEKIIICVGTGLDRGLKSNKFYLNSLLAYKSIALGSQKRGFQCIYRPHPCERGFNHFRRFFSGIDIADVRTTLRESIKIYVGYNSSLMYEAKIHGNIVVEIVSTKVPELLFRADMKIRESEVAESIDKIMDLFDRQKRGRESPKKYRSLAQRFRKLLQVIQSPKTANRRTIDLRFS